MPPALPPSLTGACSRVTAHREWRRTQRERHAEQKLRDGRRVGEGAGGREEEEEEVIDIFSLEL